MSKALGISMNNLSIFFWNISPAGVCFKCSLIYQYLWNGQENVFKCDDISLHFRVWYPELASISIWYLTPVSLRGMSFSIGPLKNWSYQCLFNCARSRGNLTFQSVLSTKANCCTTLMFHQHLMSSSFSVFVVYKLLILVMLDTGKCSLIPAKKICP